jgi:hypothetical protein
MISYSRINMKYFVLAFIDGGKLVLYLLYMYEYVCIYIYIKFSTEKPG